MVSVLRFSLPCGYTEFWGKVSIAISDAVQGPALSSVSCAARLPLALCPFPSSVKHALTRKPSTLLFMFCILLSLLSLARTRDN